MCEKRESIKRLVLGLGLALPLLAVALVANVRGPLLQVAVVQMVPAQTGMVEVNDLNYHQEFQFNQHPVFIWFKSPTRELCMEADGKLVENVRRLYGSRVKFALVDLRQFADCARVATSFGMADANASLTFCLAYPREPGFASPCVFGYGRRRISQQEVQSMFDKLL